ncbi:putative F-box domain, galactose oxidase/kelch, beta-propeller, F-box associated interaction [Helianthus annuus]|nr:putative F-box domain, galactose oxidase/kelch, beta-propeller, F-box associated interaction [Helianthus annuus]
MSDEVYNDLMVNIFERLPLKSIIRFRSLSKYWHSSIASQEFIRNHSLRCSKNPPKVLIRHLTYCGNYTFKDIYTLHSADQLPLDPARPGYMGIPGVSFPYRHRTTEIVGSFNGIICLCDDKEISLWNLSIRRRLIVPYPPSKSSPNVHVTLGFGFDPITNDYKIVSISCNKSELDENNTFIYSLKTDSWSTIPSPSTPFYYVKSNACFFNGILHWAVNGYLTTEPTTRHRSSFMLTFDFSGNVFGYKLLPLEDGYFCKGGHGWLRVMKEYGKTESWPELCKLQKESLLGTNFYNPQTGSYTKLLEFGPDCYKVEMDMYVESLELLDKERSTTCGKTIFSWTKKGDGKKIKLSRMYIAFAN